MCLGSKTTQSPAASNTNYFGTNPWGDTPGGATPDITPPAVTTTAQGGSTGSSDLKIGGGRPKGRRAYETKDSPTRAQNDAKWSGSSGVNY